MGNNTRTPSMLLPLLPHTLQQLANSRRNSSGSLLKAAKSQLPAVLACSGQTAAHLVQHVVHELSARVFIQLQSITQLGNLQAHSSSSQQPRLQEDVGSAQACNETARAQGQPKRAKLIALLLACAGVVEGL